MFHAQLGADLRELREARGWSLSDTVNYARRRKLAALTLNKLRWLEEGRTKHPDADVLRTLATLYQIEYLQLAARYCRANYGVDLPTTLDPPLGGGEWRLLPPEERELIDRWRVSTTEGKQAARAVLSVSKRKRRKAHAAPLKARA